MGNPAVHPSPMRTIATSVLTGPLALRAVPSAHARRSPRSPPFRAASGTSSILDIGVPSSGSTVATAAIPTMQPNPRDRKARLFALAGVAILVLSGAGAVIGYLEGTLWGALETPPTLVVKVAHGAAPSYLTSFPDGQVQGFAYDAPLHSYIASVQNPQEDGGWLVPFGAGAAPPTSWQTVCNTFIGSIYYPGSGPSVFVQCGSPPAWDLVEVNATTLLPIANISLGPGAFFGSFASDEANDQLYYQGLSGTVWIIDTREFEVTANVSLPGDTGYSAGSLAFDPTAGALLAGDWGTQSLVAINPTTGAMVSSTPLPANVTSMIAAPQVGRLYVDTGGNITVLNASSLAPVARLPFSGGNLYYSSLDTESGQAVFSDGYSILVINVTRDAIVDTSGTLPDQGNLVAFGPGSVAVAVAQTQEGCQTGCVGTFNLEQTYTTSAPFSAMPYFGTQAPWDLGGLGALTGLSLSVGAAIWGRPRKGESGYHDEEDFDDPVREADEIEAARQRWLSEADRQHRDEG